MSCALAFSEAMIMNKIFFYPLWIGFEYEGSEADQKLPNFSQIKMEIFVIMDEDRNYLKIQLEIYQSKIKVIFLETALPSIKTFDK